MSESKELVLPSSFVFMKVGEHAGEPFDRIIERKRREIADAGVSFWGYGGTACHPIGQVQPFMRAVTRAGEIPYLVMQKIKSNADPEIYPATEYSADATVWQPIPKGVRVIGSRYALILGEITEGDLLISLDDYEVGIGPSRGKVGSEYVAGRIDKACLRRAEESIPGGVQADQQTRLSFVARLQEPFAVLLR